MDEFDVFNQTREVTETSSDEQNSNPQEDDLFGSDYPPTNTTVAASTNPFNNVQQQPPDISWVMDNDLTDTPTTQTTLFDENSLDDLTSVPQTTSSGDDLFTDQSDINEVESNPTSNPPSTANELLYNNADRRPSENSLSFNMFSNSVSSSTTTNDTNQFYSSENLSPTEAFNTRRQQELAEMEVIEKQKIEELRQQGKKELERWYEDRNARMEQKRRSIKEEEDDELTKALQKSDKETCDWAKVIRLLDFSQGTQLTKQKRDINRMRAVIIQAKRDKDDRKSENGV